MADSQETAGSNITEDSAISIIKIIMYIIAVVIILITLITIINYALYTVYSIQAVVKELTYSESPFFKQKDIYNYMLINYIHLLKKQNYNVTYVYYKTYDVVNVKTSNATADTDADEGYPDTVLTTYFSDTPENKISKFEKNKQLLEKWLRTKVINSDKQNYIVKDDKKERYIIGEKVESPVPASVTNIPNNIIEELNILHDQDISYVLIQRGIPNGLDKAAMEKATGIYDMYKININNTQNIYGYFTKLIGDLIPMNLINMNDDKASSLYIQINNSFYALVLMLIFVILLIIFIKMIYTFYYNIIISMDKSANADMSVISDLQGKNIDMSLILITIVVYCIIHSIIYKYLFVNNVYDRVYDMYGELIKPDMYVSSCINTYRKKHSFDDNVLDILKEMSHNGIINIYNSNQYTVVNYEKIAEISAEEQIVDFTKIMLNINKNFTVSNYNYNYYTNKFFTNIYNEITTPVVTTGTTVNTYSDIKASVEYKSSLLFVLIIYIYFINNNKEDPYIIIKLNKLIFGTVANIGIPNIDKDIEYTLLLRSLVYEKLDIENMKTYITNIKDGVVRWSQDDRKENNIKEQIKTAVNLKVNTFINLFATTNDNLNFWTPVYFLNLYLAVEIGVNLLAILAVLIIISNYSKNPDIEKYIQKVKAYISTAIEELQTAVIGVI